MNKSLNILKFHICFPYNYITLDPVGTSTNFEDNYFSNVYWWYLINTISKSCILCLLKSSYQWFNKKYTQTIDSGRILLVNIEGRCMQIWIVIWFYGHIYNLLMVSPPQLLRQSHATESTTLCSIYKRLWTILKF